MSSLTDVGPLAVVGAGPSGSLLALYLAQRGHEVDLFESRGDLRVSSIDAGRSINLALAVRGIVALEAAGISDQVAELAIPMVGRMVHADDSAGLQPYGSEAHEVIYSINRGDLNGVLLTAAEATGRVRIHFDHRLRSVDLDDRRLHFTTPDDVGEDFEIVVPFGLVFGADGTNSLVRARTVEVNGGEYDEDVLDHGYKEITIPAAEGGGFRIDANALHIWPRGDFMLIALANPEGDFTATLFMPNEPGSGHSGGSFAELESSDAVGEFFDREFPEFAALVPDLEEQYLENPTGDLSTIRCSNWSHDDASVILGDAAHGIVPFHGQGMNAAMESAQVLVAELEATPDDLAGALARFSERRKPDADAIAQMALDNYVEMRSSVVDPKYLIKRELALELQRRHPDRFAARYGMVMFTTIPYSEVAHRALQQNVILSRLTEGCETVANVDMAAADKLVGNLDSIDPETIRPVQLNVGAVK